MNLTIRMPVLASLLEISLRYTFLKLFLALAVLCLGIPALDAATSFNFTLARSCRTSAGVYDSSGKLVRTLWSDAFFPAGGTFTRIWDNLDDQDVAVPAGTYTIKVIGHNLNYVWEGVVGNTSTLKSGVGTHTTMNCPATISIVGSTGCYAVGYSEHSSPFLSFSTSDPQVATARFSGSPDGNNNLDWIYSAGDDTRVYFACGRTQDPANDESTWPGAVCSFDPVTGASVNFTAGGPIYNSHHTFSNGVRVGTGPSITGIAAQKVSGGTLLAVSVSMDNKVYLLDKSSGSVVRSFTVTSPGELAFDNSNNLWVVTGTSVANYNNLTTTPTLVRTIFGFAKPLALSVSPTTGPQPNLLLVVDGGSSQQVKAYNMTGTSQWTLGQAGGYATSPIVSNDKFWFFNPQDGGGSEHSSLAFQSDGQFWLVDQMNCRSLRFQLSPTAGALPVYQTTLSLLSANYTICADPNNPSRLFVCMSRGRILEYNVDHSKSLSPTTGSWTLIRNWTYGLSGDFVGYVQSGFTSVATLSNGRTYGLICDEGPARNRAVVELPSTGNLRFTGLSTSSRLLQADGSLRYYSKSGQTHSFKKQALTGFDASFNPVWAASTTIATAPAVSGVDPSQATDSAGPRVPITSTNKLIFFDNSGNNGPHLGAINLGTSTSSWEWKAAQSVPAQYPLWGDGSYDTSTSIHYYGALADALGRDIIFGYKGENWHGSQANQLMHFYDNGLFVGQFGTPNDGPDVAPQGAAGNIMRPFLVNASSKTFLYTNDEGVHSGIHRWRFDGANTVGELVGTVALNSITTLFGTAPIGTAPTVTGAPSRVTQLNATPANGHVFLQWTEEPGATYYQVRRSTESNRGFQIMATAVFGNCYNDMDVTNGVTYYYTVVPINDKGAGNAAVETPGTPNTGTNVYEAEDGVLVGINYRSDTGASGQRQTQNGSSTAASVTINNVDGGIGGVVPLRIRYSHGSSSNWSGHIFKVNGTTVTLPAIPGTGAYQGGAYNEISVNITLNTGSSNTIEFKKPPCLDKITVVRSTPFLGVPTPIPSGSGSVKIEAENYNYGGEGLAYHDSHTPDSGSVYRAFDGVNITASPQSNGFHVSSINGAEWLTYTVSVPATKAYTLNVRAAASSTGRTLRVEDALGNNLTGTVAIASTGGWGNYADHTATINLAAGTQTLKFYMVTGGYNLDHFTIGH